MPVLKWEKSVSDYVDTKTWLGDRALSFASSCVARCSARCNLWLNLDENESNDADSVGCVSPVPDSVDELFEKMEEIISKLYPEEYLKAVLQRVEDKAGGCRAGAEVVCRRPKIVRGIENRHCVVCRLERRSENERLV